MADDFTLTAYRALLKAGLDAGYAFLKFTDIGAEGSERSCLLRHDVDSELLALDGMLAVERDLGIKATYFVMTRSTAYNPFSVEGRSAIERILADGHSLGLHFMGELCEGMPAGEVSTRVLREKAWLEEEFGTSVDVVSFHQPTRAILDGQIVVPGMCNTYNKSQTDPYIYVSDTNMTWRHEHPAEIFERGLHPRLQLLVHPMWWTPASVDLRTKWQMVLEHNRRSLLDHWRARERSLSDIDL